MPMAQTLLVPLGSLAAAREAVDELRDLGSMTTLRVPMLGTREGRRLLAQRYERVVITGSPPTAEIGFGLAALIVPLVRARHVILVDDRTGEAKVKRTPSFLPAAVPRALYQLAASAAAVADDLALLRGGIRTHADVIYQRHARFSLCGAVLATVRRLPLFLEYNASEEL